MDWRMNNEMTLGIYTTKRRAGYGPLNQRRSHFRSNFEAFAASTGTKLSPQEDNSVRASDAQKPNSTARADSVLLIMSFINLSTSVMLCLVPNSRTLKVLIRIPLVGFSLCCPRHLPYEVFMSSIHLSMNLLLFVPNRCSSQPLIIQAI
jgi:hypothetical protein